MHGQPKETTLADPSKAALDAMTDQELADAAQASIRRAKRLTE